MKVGVVVPQGWTGEYAGWEPRRAWSRSLEFAAEAEALGFDSLWVYDHFLTEPEPRAVPVFESFTMLAFLAARTHRVRLGQVVVCAGYRNPALVAKMAACLDVMSGGRFELGLGAGWHETEYLAYGYAFPALRDRLAVLADHLEIVRRMLDSPTATYQGRYARVVGAMNLPRPLQARLPLIVGGNGQKVTWRLAARFADELNLDGPDPATTAAWRSVIAERCREVGRDPASLAVSVAPWSERVDGIKGAARIALLRGYREAGVARVMWPLPSGVANQGALESLASDVVAAGSPLAGHAPVI